MSVWFVLREYKGYFRLCFGVSGASDLPLALGSIPFPVIPEGKPVVLSGRGPDRLVSALTAHYKDRLWADPQWADIA